MPERARHHGTNSPNKVVIFEVPEALNIVGVWWLSDSAYKMIEATEDQFRDAISLLKAERDPDVMTSSGGNKRGGAVIDTDRLSLPLQRSFKI